MRRYAGWALFAVMLFAACSSSGSDKASTTSSEPSTSSSTTPATSTTRRSTTTLVPTTSTPAAPSTTKPACATPAGMTAYATPPAATSANVLLDVRVASQPCQDVVTFAFRPDKGAPPQCRVSYQPGPFTETASGKEVTVAGSAYLVVRCEPARSYDLLTGKTTYTAPPSKHIPVGSAANIRDVVATGDFEGVMTWVIGVDGRQPFQANAAGNGTLTVTVY